MNWPGSTRPAPKFAGQGCEWGPSPHSPPQEPEALSFSRPCRWDIALLLNEHGFFTVWKGAHHTLHSWVTSVLILASVASL